MKSLIIESWRFVPHSFALVNQFQCLELLRRNHLKIFHRDLPYYGNYWQPTRGLLEASQEAQLESIPAPPPQDDYLADLLFRISYPFRFEATAARKLAVFGVCNFGAVPCKDLQGVQSLQEATADPKVVIITPSHWSKEGFVRSGADPEKVAVVPHGVDPLIFHPLTGEEREQMRREFQWEDDLVFLNVGTMTRNKGLPALLRSFSQTLRRHPRARLVLKGLDSLYRSQDFLKRELETSPRPDPDLLERIEYIGGSLRMDQMARLYQAADVYVSPYSGEGFNLPVLEAAACGLPLICTEGGPTDEFTTADFALRIRSAREPLPLEGQTGIRLVPDEEHLSELMIQALEDLHWRNRAKQSGPVYVQSRLTWHHVVNRLMSVLQWEK